jgi:hypothetical protein
MHAAVMPRQQKHIMHFRNRPSPQNMAPSAKGFQLWGHHAAQRAHGWGGGYDGVNTPFPTPRFRPRLRKGGPGRSVRAPAPLPAATGAEIVTTNHTAAVTKAGGLAAKQLHRCRRTQNRNSTPGTVQI